MWKRKTEDDYKKAIKEREKEEIFLGLTKNDILASLCIAILITIYFCVFEIDVYSDTEISSKVMCFILSFVACCIGVRFFGNPIAIFTMFTAGTSSSEIPSVICNVCHSIVSQSKKEKYECGGEYEPLEDWKWDEDEIEESKQTN